MYTFLILVDFSFKNFELNPNTSECGFPGGSVVKNMPVNTGDAGDSGLIPESGRSPGGGNSSPLQYSCLGNATDRGIWWAIVHGVAKSRTQLSTHMHGTSECGSDRV